MGGSLSITGIGQRSVSETAAGTYTDALDMGDSGNADVVVETSGAATLTVEFSTTGDFAGEEFAFTTDYDAATEITEQFSPAHQFVRAKVDANLTSLDVIRRGV